MLRRWQGGHCLADGAGHASLIAIADLSPLLNPLHRSSMGPGNENRPELTHASAPTKSALESRGMGNRARNGLLHPFGRGGATRQRALAGTRLTSRARCAQPTVRTTRRVGVAPPSGAGWATPR